MVGRAVIPAIGSFFFPGFGHAVIGRNRWAIAWAVAVPVAMLLVFVSMWFFLIAFALRLLSVLHAFWSAARASTFEWFAPLVFGVGAISVVSFAGMRLFVIEGFKTPSSSMYPTLQIGDDIFVDKLSSHWRTYQRGDIVVFEYPCDPKRDYVKRIMAVGGDTVEVRCNIVYVNGKAVPSTLVDAPCSYDDFDESRNAWHPSACSRYHETIDGRPHDVFHDPGRPERDKLGAPDGDARDFPKHERPSPPSCSAAAEWEPTPSKAKRAPPLGKIVQTKTSAGSCEQQLQFVVPAGTIFTMGDNRSNSNDSRVWGVVSLDAVKGRAIGVWLSNGKSGLDWSRVGEID